MSSSSTDSEEEDLPTLEQFWDARRRLGDGHSTAKTATSVDPSTGLSSLKSMNQASSSLACATAAQPARTNQSTPRRRASPAAPTTTMTPKPRLQACVKNPASSERRRQAVAAELFPPSPPPTDLRSPLNAYRERNSDASSDEEDDSSRLTSRRSIVRSIVSDSESDSPAPLGSPQRERTTGQFKDVTRVSMGSVVPDSEDEDVLQIGARSSSVMPRAATPTVAPTRRDDQVVLDSRGLNIDMSSYSASRRDAAATPRTAQGPTTPRHGLGTALTPTSPSSPFMSTELIVADNSDEEDVPNGRSRTPNFAADNDDLDPNAGVLTYEPTPRKPKKLASSVMNSPVPRAEPRSSRKTPTRSSRRPPRIVEIDLTASSDSEGDDDESPRHRGKPSRALPSAATPTRPLPSKPTRKREPETFTSASPRLPGKTLTPSLRDTLPLQLIRELDRTVFRKRWDGARCLDAEDEFTGQGLPDGITVKWNNKLRNTAGRASWKKVKAGTTTTHVTSIDLATKVTDTEEKLRHTLSHELCHIAAWVLSHEIKPPHGDAFKLWARRIMSVRSDITITTTHSYEIAYKYRWRCLSTACSKIFSRHSRSIDPSAQGCPCGGRLGEIDAQGEPKTPRAQRTPQVKSAWQNYLAITAPIVRAENPGIKNEDVFKRVAERYQRDKSLAAAAEAENTERQLSAALDVLQV